MFAKFALGGLLAAAIVAATPASADAGWYYPSYGYRTTYPTPNGGYVNRGYYATPYQSSYYNSYYNPYSGYGSSYRYSAPVYGGYYAAPVYGGYGYGGYNPGLYLNFRIR